MIAPRGYILWEGPSRIDGAPIVAIATMKTSNRKTGPMVQTWILRADMLPTDAIKSRADVSICGACRHRGHPRTGKGRSCYVNVGQAPQAVYRAYMANRYSRDWTPETFAGRKVRLGAYGDPAAVPVDVWSDVVSLADGHTGYTHQWRNPALRDVLQFCQASVDTPGELTRARSLPVVGSFRVMRSGETLQSGEKLCPASVGSVTCADCMACDGSSAIAIPVHGSGAKHHA